MERLFRAPFEDWSSLTLPGQLPVMVLSDCYHFPGCVLPLFIFEPRYRQMLSFALASHRMFCIGTRTSDDEILPVTTAGVVRECVTHEDGTSHLVLFGLRRVRLTSWVQETPFRIARIEPMETVEAPPDRLQALLREALSALPTGVCGDVEQALKRFCEKVEKGVCPQLACDLMTYHFVQCPEVLQQSLNTCCPVRRFELLIDALKSHA